MAVFFGRYCHMAVGGFSFFGGKNFDGGGKTEV